MKLLLSFAVCLFLPLLSQASDVLILTDSDFETKIKQHSVLLVEFYAPWCGHCKALKPKYEAAATRLLQQDPPINIAQVDCTAETKTCEKYGVSGYPTLKVFKNGAFAFDYSDDRSEDAIVNYMIAKSGPSSKELKTEAELEAFLQKEDSVIVGYFSTEGSSLQKTFQTVADGMSDQFRFAHSTTASVLSKSGFSDAIVLHRPKRLNNKFEDSAVKFTGSDDSALRRFIEENVMGLCGHRTSSNSKYFDKKPLVIAYYNVDYVKNPKGTNYWRNRVMKIAKKVKTATGKDVYFAVSNANDLSWELGEYGLEGVDNEKVHIVARDADNRKYKMTEEFSMESFEKWLTDFLDNKHAPYLKSEPVPSDNSAPVKVAVAKNFDELVNDPDRDVLVEFYAPWCGHCKSLAPKYDELAEKLKDEPEIRIVKMDATANDVPAPYQVQGFPTLYFSPKSNKANPRQYQGGREVNDFIEYLAREATNPLKGYDRSGKKKKTEL